MSGRQMDEARELGGGAGFEEQERADIDDSAARAAIGKTLGTGAAGQALRVIEGEEYARAWLERLHAGEAEPGELAVILSFLDGDYLHGACRVIEKALGGAAR